MLAALSPGAAAAAVGGSATIASETLLHGRSLSAGRPVASVALAYDDVAGPYAGVALSGLATRGAGPRPLGEQVYAGFAHRVRPELTLDLGVTDIRYTRWWSGGRAAGYTELYAGLRSRRLSGRLSLSPNYFGGGVTTLYGEVAAVLVGTERWQLDARAGLFLWLAGGRPPGAAAAHHDWRIGIARRLGRLSLSAAWVAGGPERDVYAGRARRRGRPVLALTAGF